MNEKLRTMSQLMCQLICILHANSACDSSVSGVGLYGFQAFGPAPEVKAALDSCRLFSV